MAEITDVANAMFRSRDRNLISSEDKEKFFFIFNRYFAKRYPEKAQMLNLKGMDKAAAMDIWFAFMKTQPYPDWFWSKSPKMEKDLPEKEYKSLLKHLEVKEQDLDYILDRFPDFAKEELAYLKKLDKGNN
jgi:hypothetical protein